MNQNLNNVLTLSEPITSEYDKDLILNSLNELFEILSKSIGTKFKWEFTGSFQHYKNLSFDEKEFYNDVDILFEKKYKEELEKILIPLSYFGKYQYIGKGRNKVHFNTIFLFPINDNKKIYFQIDFNFCELNDFDKFAHYSSIYDLKMGIKGVFHKYLINSILTSYDNENLRYRFSIFYGIRNTLNNDKNYISDLPTIFNIMFNNIPITEYSHCYSFNGLIYLININFDIKQRFKILDIFENHLYGKQARIIEKNEEEDKLVKFIAIEYFRKYINGI